MTFFFFACSFGLPERSTENSTVGVNTEYTPVACIMNNTVFSQAQITYVLVVQELNGSGLQRHHSAHENSQSSGQPFHLFAYLFHTFSLPVHHNTKHNQDSTTFSKTTLYTDHLFQNLYSRQAAVAETRAIFLPHSLSLSLLCLVCGKTDSTAEKCLRPIAGQ